MRFLGNPFHVMVIHFPVALWPAHWCFHVFARWLPPGMAAPAGFWVLAAGTAVGWIAALFGLADLLALSPTGGTPFRNALIHGGVNGSVLLGFTVLFGLELPRYPAIVHGSAALVIEAALLALLGIGNHFGGSVIWERMPAGVAASEDKARRVPGRN